MKTKEERIQVCRNMIGDRVRVMKPEDEDKNIFIPGRSNNLTEDWALLIGKFLYHDREGFVEEIWSDKDINKLIQNLYCISGYHRDSISYEQVRDGFDWESEFHYNSQVQKIKQLQIENQRLREKLAAVSISKADSKPKMRWGETTYGLKEAADKLVREGERIQTWRDRSKPRGQQHAFRRRVKG